MRLILIFVLSVFLCTQTNSRLQDGCLQTADLVGNLPNFTGTVQPCSYSGFAPLDNDNNSALFYWYFPNQQGNKDAPLLIWLQGGPGSSSLWGMLTEYLGPFSVIPNEEGGYSLDYNDKDGGMSWSYFYDIIFIDNPVGTGYSYTATEKYPTNLDDVILSLLF